MVRKQHSEDVVVRWPCAVIVASCIWHGTAGAQSVDFVIANFSNAMLRLFEIQNGRGKLVRDVEVGYSHGHRGAVGSVWRINWLTGREVCKFEVHERMTIVVVDAPAAPRGWETQTIAGFQVLFSPALLRDEASSARAHQFMRDQLDAVTRLVPPAALQQLRRVRLWLDLDASGSSRALAFYKSPPSIFTASPAGRPTEHNFGYGGFHGAMFLGIVFPNIVDAIAIGGVSRAPMIVLHELAHAYHHQVLGMWNPDIKQTYEAAKAKGLYRNASFWNGNVAPVGYAMSNEREYFAGLTEAYFGRNAQNPLDANELKSHDPDGFRLVERAWNGALESIAPITTVACRSPD
jgi:hypothetical protein